MAAPKRSERVRQAVKNDMSDRVLRRRKPERMTQHNFRMSESDYEALAVHFQNLRLSIGAGIRMVLRKYMEAEGIPVRDMDRSR